jgi:hypothetical protein
MSLRVPSALLARLGQLGALAVLGGLAGCVGAPAVVRPAGYAAVCYAGPYVCQLPGPARVGTQCTCPGLGAPSFGAVR